MGVWPRNILVGPLFESACGIWPLFLKFLEATLNVTVTLLNKINIETDSYKGLHSVERCLNIFFLPFSLANAKMTARPCSVYAAATVYSAGMTRLV